MATAGRVVGKYELIVEMSKGPLGALWVARGVGNENLFALRRIQTGAPLSVRDVDRLSEAAYFALEVQNAALAEHVDVVKTAEELAIVARYFPSESLRSLLRLTSFKRKPIPIPIALRIALDMLDGLDALQADAPTFTGGGNMASGGWSPESVLIGTDGITRLIDAGVVSAAEATPSLSQHPDVTAYQSPETLEDQIRADSRSDVFSIGVMLWEMLSGRRLHVGSSHTAAAEKVRTTEAQRLDAPKATSGDVVPTPIANVLVRALAHDTATRFGSSRELADALRGATQRIATHADVGALVHELAANPLEARERAIARALGKPAPPHVEGRARSAPPPAPKARQSSSPALVEGATPSIPAAPRVPSLYGDGDSEPTTVRQTTAPPPAAFPTPVPRTPEAAAPPAPEPAPPPAAAPAPAPAPKATRAPAIARAPALARAPSMSGAPVPTGAIPAKGAKKPVEPREVVAPPPLAAEKAASAKTAAAGKTATKAVLSKVPPPPPRTKSLPPPAPSRQTDAPVPVPTTPPIPAPPIPQVAAAAARPPLESQPDDIELELEPASKPSETQPVAEPAPERAAKRPAVSAAPAPPAPMVRPGTVSRRPAEPPRPPERERESSAEAPALAGPAGAVPAPTVRRGGNKRIVFAVVGAVALVALGGVVLARGSGGADSDATSAPKEEPTKTEAAKEEAAKPEPAPTEPPSAPAPTAEKTEEPAAVPAAPEPTPGTADAAAPAPKAAPAPRPVARPAPRKAAAPKAPAPAKPKRKYTPGGI